MGLRWGKEFPHTLNGSFLPLGRTLAALLEYHDGDVALAIEALTLVTG